MTSIERVAALFDGKVPDKPPLMHISFSSRSASHILGREAYVGGGIHQWREAKALWQGPDAHAEFIERSHQDAIAIALACNHDMIRTFYWRDKRKPAKCIDEYTFRYEDADGNWEVKQLDPVTELYNTIAESPRKELTLEDLPAIVEQYEAQAKTYNAAGDDDYDDVKYMINAVGNKMAIRGFAPSNVIPVNNPIWLEATMLAPELVGRYLDAQLTVSLKKLKFAVGLGLKYLFGGGDFASNQGPMYSPQVFHELMLPRLKKVSEACHQLGAYHLFGTDGNVWPVAEDLYRKSGVDGHYEFDRRAGMNPVEVHEKYPHLVMVGNLSSHVLHTGTPADVEREVRECLDEARKTNKMITGCSNIIISETPAENVEAMMKAIAKYR